MKKIIVIFILLSAVFITSAALAQQTTSDPKVHLDNPLTGNSSSVSVPVLIGNIIKAVLGIVGSLSLVMFIYGGFTWMTSSGNTEKVTKGKNILVWATIGLIVIFSSYAILRFIFESLGV